MNTLDKKYQELLQDILDNGVTKSDRTGTGTISVFGRQIRHKMSEGFPLLTTKKMAWKTMVTELLWFLRGDTNIKFLVDNNCHIWDGDAYKNYLFNSDWHPISSVNRGFIGTKTDSDEIMTQELFINKIKTDDEFAKKWGELGPIYGKQWRSWKSASLEEQWGYGEIDGHPIGGKQYSKFNTNVHIDQIQNLINDLKNNPDSRRLMVNAWNVGELDQMVLPPCHYGFQVYTRELSFDERFLILSNMDLLDTFHNLSDKKYKARLDELNIPSRAISLMWNQRSVDTFLGLPFNIASYGLLLEIIAKEVNMVPDELVGNLGDVHLYLNHIEQAKEQIGRDLTEDERYELVTQQMSKLRAITDEDYIKYNIPNRTREPYPLPKLGEIPDYLCMKDNWECYEPTDFTLENYQSHPSIKAPLSN
jgi:thymidylate synthase